jgi:2-oxo-4-hydroxy-4-carboxy-5-ureidoimidazoline decarboxylase
VTSVKDLLKSYDLTGRAVTSDTLHNFLRAYASIFEHSPWVIERAWALRPFADAEALHAAFHQVLQALERDEQLRLIRAHPQLADKVAIAHGLTDSSVAEQASAGLDRLTAPEFEAFQTMNSAYLRKYGFPFIICVRLHDKEQILSAMQHRLTRSPEEELQEAIEQISRISRLRLSALQSS